MSHPGTAHEPSHLIRALELAEGGRGRVSPNPLVGAVIERDGDILGQGFHAELGGLHAERAALADAAAHGSDVRGATMHVTLEPCDHVGRQPRCTEAILEAGITKVVIGTDDPSEKTAGKGPARLRAAGVEVEQAAGAEAAAARLLIQPFRKHVRTGRPLVTWKVASTIDGKVSLARTSSASPAGIRGGDASRGDAEAPLWISGPESRRFVHRWRADSDAVAVGIGTVLADDPELTARDVDAFRQPLRIVFDRRGRLPKNSKLKRSASDEMPVIVIGQDIGPALDELGSREITSLFLEGGPTLARAFLDAGEIDEMRLFVAPLVAGTADLPPLLAGDGTIGGAIAPLAVDHETVGADLLIKARLKEW